MATLTLGVLDVAYSDAHNSAGSATTTGDVAEILESRYEVMGNFFRLRRGKIADYLADGMAGAIQDLVAGHPKLGDPMHDVAQKIEREFRSYLDANELQKISIALFGAPISAAAERGVNHRKKRPFAKKNKPRPAFIDTGLYRASFRAIVNL